MNNRLLQGIIVLLIVIGFYFLAHEYSLYYIFWWFDWAQHFLGGVGLGLVFCSFWPKNQIRILGITGIIAIGWELFERVGHEYLPMYISYGGPRDTIIDILCAIIGASLVLLATRE